MVKIKSVVDSKQNHRKNQSSRLVDVICAGLAFLITVPFFLLISIGILMFMGRPIFFRQVRIGINNKPFVLIKFRTMVSDENGQTIPEFGKFLRAYSLDEIPELLNIIKGEMTFVGPRPLPIEYLPRFSKTELIRHQVLPGITGLAQIKGRNSTSWANRLRLDVWYVEHRSIGLDLKIVWLTFLGLLGLHAFEDDRYRVMPEFRSDKRDPER